MGEKPFFGYNIIAATLADYMGLPFVGIRKDSGFLPGDLYSETSGFDYRGNQHKLRLQKAAFSPGSRVVLADDWQETLTQALCVQNLLGQAEVSLAGIATIVDQAIPERKANFEIYHGLITNVELFQGREQRDYQKESGKLLDP